MILRENGDLAEGLNDFFGFKNAYIKGAYIIIGTHPEWSLTIRFDPLRSDDDKALRVGEAVHPVCPATKKPSPGYAASRRR